METVVVTPAATVVAIPVAMGAETAVTLAVTQAAIMVVTPIAMLGVTQVTIWMGIQKIIIAIKVPPRITLLHLLTVS